MFHGSTCALTLLFLVIGVTPSAAQTPALTKVMNDKVLAAERLLRPIVTADFALIDRYSNQLRGLTRSVMASWEAQPDDAYLQQATSLVQSIQEIREGVRMRDIERASVGYAAMLSACVQCHEVVRSSRVARRGRALPRKEPTP
jgi:hypothetical protein